MRNDRSRTPAYSAVGRNRHQVLHPRYAFTYKGHGVKGMYNTAWRQARKKAAENYQRVLGRPCPEGFLHVRVHDLKHTFGRRLRAADVSFEDRQDLLGHKSGRITTHYSAAELRNLIAAANRVCREDSRTRNGARARGRLCD